MKNLIKLQSIEVETGKTIVKIAIQANEVPHPQLSLSSEEEKENRNAVLFLKKMMNDLGFEMKKPKVWIKPNNWNDKNDNVESFLDMDFSDTFPTEEKSRIEKLVNLKLS